MFPAIGILPRGKANGPTGRQRMENASFILSQTCRASTHSGSSRSLPHTCAEAAITAGKADRNRPRRAFLPTSTLANRRRPPYLTHLAVRQFILPPDRVQVLERTKEDAAIGDGGGRIARLAQVVAGKKLKLFWIGRENVRRPALVGDEQLAAGPFPTQLSARHASRRGPPVPARSPPNRRGRRTRSPADRSGSSGRRARGPRPGSTQSIRPPPPVACYESR